VLVGFVGHSVGHVAELWEDVEVVEELDVYQLDGVALVVLLGLTFDFVFQTRLVVAFPLAHLQEYAHALEIQRLFVLQFYVGLVLQNANHVAVRSVEVASEKHFKLNCFVDGSEVVAVDSVFDELAHEFSQVRQPYHWLVKKTLGD